MAISGYTPIDFSECLDESTIIPALDSIQAIANAAETNNFDIGCRPINTSLRGDTAFPQDECVTIIEDSGRRTGNIQKCIFMITYRSVFQFPNGNFEGDTDIEVTIRCGGQPVATFRAQEDPDTSIGAVVVTADCDTGEGIEICARGSFVSTSNEGGLTRGALWNLSLCGGLACIAQRGLGSNFWIPCTLTPECRFGMEALFLMVDSLNTLCDAYSSNSRIVECISLQDVEYDPLQPTIIAANVPTETAWLGFGKIVFCPRDFRGANFYDIQPIIGCQSDPEFCLSARIELPDDRPNQSFLRNRCYQIPVLGCGNCPPGETLVIGHNDQLICDDVTDRPDNSVNADITADWCFWLFRRQNLTLGERLKQPSKCLSFEKNLKPIQDKAEAVHQVACDRQPIECIQYKVDVSITSEDQQQDLVGAVALPNPPPNPLPVPWPPERKWALNGNMTACFSGPAAGNMEEEAWFAVNYVVYCGGVEVSSSMPLPFQFNDSGAGNNVCVNLSVVEACITCQIDEPITIGIEFERIAGVGFAVISSVSVSGDISVTSF